LLSVLGATAAHAQKIVRQDGSTMDGEVTAVHGGQADVKLASGTISLPLTAIKKVEMPAPQAVVAARTAAPAATIATLEPLLQNFQGLPADWITEAMSLLGNAYAEKGDFDKASALFDQVDKLSGGQGASPQTGLGRARIAIRQGHADEAKKYLQPLLDKAHATISPDSAQAASFSTAFLLQGQVLEAAGDAPGALESYLTAALLAPDAPSLATAQGKADALRAAHPGTQVP
jgi:tetratricopeptide (TPR) repeat protein